jgi:hypothetical protein
VRPATIDIRASIADQFRDAIALATADGAPLDALVLILTRGDADKLKRDRAIAVSDISFADGEMRYLGVRVVQGGATVSALKLGVDVAAEHAAATAKVQAPARKTRTRTKATVAQAR